MAAKTVLLRNDFLTAIRQFFTDKNFVECVTPKLVINPGLEPNLVPFKTRLHPTDMGDFPPQNLYLATSPEYHLKKILGMGLARIFEISPCYRNGEQGREHHHEFLMLEWYRCPGSYSDIADDTKTLLAELGKKFSASPSWENPYDLTVTAAFEKYLSIDLEQALEQQSFLLPAALKDNYGNLNFEDCFYALLSDCIQPQLGKTGPCFLWDFPFFGGGLSRPHSHKAGFVERFEVYWGGVEIANAFGELTDAEKQRKLCQHDQKLRQARYGHTPPLDEDFLAALKNISHPAGGIALGLDRLLMLLTDKASISEVLVFSNR